MWQYCGKKLQGKKKPKGRKLPLKYVALVSKQTISGSVRWKTPERKRCPLKSVAVSVQHQQQKISDDHQ